MYNFFYLMLTFYFVREAAFSTPYSQRYFKPIPALIHRITLDFSLPNFLPSPHSLFVY